MNSNIIPLTIRPHLVFFLIKELTGTEKIFAGFKCKTYDLSKDSLIGRFIIDRLDKCDYPVKNVEKFNFFLEIKNTTRKRWIANGKFFKIENLSRSFVVLPDIYKEEVNDLIEQQFRTVFYSYVAAYKDDEETISMAILRFIEKYDLFEAGFSQIQLRKLYYRMRESGGVCAQLQGKLSRN
ncbi:Uncharacterised protein [Chryseobacterium nakagawai]|uniref:Uncharacterized protein n=1 Tax=Chryseobacterium nakagawai TaxID=1241982 RepID=A0AAD0YQ60_CHRNA|nr:hypothetical protein [Chryseobacterium nakagawai]AZA93029.1 hypothetical protein EG343_21710 [Chryseobacterium nakagawai]VEH19661.1 Uncharacterised protein [Chryseobacterium nakagawai]